MNYCALSRLLHRSSMALTMGVLVLVTFLTGCADDEDAPPAASGDASPTEVGTIPDSLQVSWPNVPIDAIFSDPGGFVGRKVVAHGEVVEIITANAIVIQDDQDAILVVGADLGTEELAVGTFVRVNGAVRDFDIPEIEGELGFDLQDDRLAEFHDQPSIVASLVTVGVTSVEDLLEHAGVFVGREVAVTGQVADVFEGGAVMLQANDADGTLLAIPTESIDKAQLDEGSWVRVVGEVGVFDPEAHDDVADALVSEFPGSLDDMIYVAVSEIEPVAPAPTTTVGEIVDEPEAYAGEQVTIAAEVADVLSRRVIIAEGDSALLGLGRSEIPILVQGMDLADLDGGETVVLRGVVAVNDDHRSIIADELDMLDPELRERVLEGPVLIAESLVVVEPE